MNTSLETQLMIQVADMRGEFKALAEKVSVHLDAHHENLARETNVRQVALATLLAVLSLATSIIVVVHTW